MSSMLLKIKFRIAKINEWIAWHTVEAMASMGCVYVFILWSLLPTINRDWEQFALYVSSGIIQLVALPLIMVGQRVEGKKIQRRADADSERLREILEKLNKFEASGKNND